MKFINIFCVLILLFFNCCKLPTVGYFITQPFIKAYETKFGTGYPDSIVTRKKGKLDDTMLLSPLSRTRRMRPSKDKFYRVDILELHSVIATIIKEF